jgi:Uma2 family endonuclease
MDMPARVERQWTAAEVRALPDEPGKRFEVIDGELFVSPAPSWPHQTVVLEFAMQLDEYVHSSRLGRAMFSPADIEADKHTLVQPDVFVVPRTRGRMPRAWREVRHLLLAVEVLSPSSGRRDRVTKRRKYSEMGAEYWIVDGKARCVERWMPGADQSEIVRDSIAWCPAGAASPLSINLRELFSSALDDA